MKALQKLYKSFIMKTFSKLYRRFIKKFHVYMLLKEDVDFNALHTFKMWLNEYFLNSWHHNYETRMKIIGKVQMFL